MLQVARDRIDSFLNKVYRKHKSGIISVVVPDPLAGLLVSVLQQNEFKNICQTRSDCGEELQIISPVPSNV